MDKIKKCPFCGGEDVKVKEDQNFVYYEGFYYAECQNCKATGGTAKTVNKAITMWNIRSNA
jgi:Lar family restriction alleviation protein